MSTPRTLQHRSRADVDRKVSQHDDAQGIENEAKERVERRLSLDNAVLRRCRQSGQAVTFQLRQPVRQIPQGHDNLLDKVGKGVHIVLAYPIEARRDLLQGVGGVQESMTGIDIGFEDLERFVVGGTEAIVAIVTRLVVPKVKQRR